MMEETNKKTADDDSMPFTQHLEELRKRLIYICITVGVGFIATYSISDKIIAALKKPLGQDLIFISPTEAFFVNLKAAFFSAIVLTVPFILYQVWKFTAPGLLEKEKKAMIPFVFFSTVMFLVGGLFAYFIILPFGMKFLLAYGSSDIKPMISLGNYISFTTKLILAFGVVFELPIIMVFLTKLGIITPAFLARNRKYAVMIVFIVAAILTPPDVFTQVLMAIPLLILYEVSIMLSKIVHRKKKEKDSDEL